MLHRICRPIVLSAAFAASLTGVAAAAVFAPFPHVMRSLVDDSNTVRLTRDLPGALAASYDSGALGGGAILPHFRLELRRPPALQAAFDRLTHDQITRGTAAYHRWLSPMQLRSYGPAQPDIDKVTAWLRRHNLTVNSVAPTGMSIDFGGSVANIAAAFHTALHAVAYRGEAHISNVSAPAIPAALAPVITGVTLANFFPKPAMHRVTPNFTVPVGNFDYYAVAPADFSTIYNIKPLRDKQNYFRASITGTGVTIAVLEETLINSADFTHFRTYFGLSSYPGTLTQVNPGNCGSPGFNGSEGEAAIDAEWADATAPSASIIAASCPPTETTFGVEAALENLVDDGTPATIFSISFGGPESAEGYSFEAGWANLLEEAASQGKAVFVASGDSGSSADRGAIDSDGLSPNGLASTPYDFAVGGTDFYDTALGENAKYWSPTNSMQSGSARSYVPEIPWDNSCASSILVAYVGGGSGKALCDTKPGYVQNGVGGGGGQSAFFNKPDWQVAAGVPNDGKRDIPDASLFAANGIWGHFYVFCMSDANEGGNPCKYGNAGETFGNAAGGTSFASPAFAGIAALVQETNEAPGQINPLGVFAPEMYSIAQGQESLPGLAAGCNSTLGNGISAACTFNDVTAGDNAEPCHGITPDCDGGSAGTIGVLRTSIDGVSVAAFPATAGYDLATGLGSVNVTNLVYQYEN